MSKKQRKGASCGASKIPKDHKGLYLSNPLSHSRQTDITFPEDITEKMIEVNLAKYKSGVRTK